MMLVGFSGNSRSVDDVAEDLVSPSTGDHIHLGGLQIITKIIK